MIKLYGMTYSNYYNIVKTLLLEKGIDFTEVDNKPTQEQDYLEKSPMGKVPCIETASGWLSETSVIIDYLEDLGQGPAFYPADPFARAKVRELIACVELYIELQARKLYGETFFGAPASEETHRLVKPQLEKGFAALLRLASFQPYLSGPDISCADFYFRFALTPVLVVCRKTLDWDAYSEVPGVRSLMERLDQRPTIKQVVAEQSSPS